VHNDSHYTDMTGEFRFLSAPPLLRDSSSHDEDYNDDDDADLYSDLWITRRNTQHQQWLNLLSKICLRNTLN